MAVVVLEHYSQRLGVAAKTESVSQPFISARCLLLIKAPIDHELTQSRPQVMASLFSVLTY